jgi:hypothetical protein
MVGRVKCSLVTLQREDRERTEEKREKGKNDGKKGDKKLVGQP